MSLVVGTCYWRVGIGGESGSGVVGTERLGRLDGLLPWWSQDGEGTSGGLAHRRNRLEDEEDGREAGEGFLKSKLFAALGGFCSTRPVDGKRDARTSKS